MVQAMGREGLEPLIPLPALKTFGTHAGIGVADVVDRARNWIDGQFGVVLLLLGFALQLLGYFVGA